MSQPVTQTWPCAGSFQGKADAGRRAETTLSEFLWAACGQKERENIMDWLEIANVLLIIAALVAGVQVASQEWRWRQYARRAKRAYWRGARR